jgi:uncharacterized protein
MGNGNGFGGKQTSRRTVLRGGAMGAGGFALANALGALSGRTRGARAAGYGTLTAKKAINEPNGPDYIALPPGFEYTVWGKNGTTMSDGHAVPIRHDGGACFWNEQDRKVYYVHNQEIVDQPNFAGSSVPSYDKGTSCGGGTTTWVLDPGTGLPVRSYASLQGTRFNCAGGRTPWKSWLTCEENTSSRTSPSVPGGPNLRDEHHGYVFEVPAFGLGIREPILGMGRFNHEAALVAGSGKVYLTEDKNYSGFYKYKPDVLKQKQPHEIVPGDLHKGGTLYMLKVKGVANQLMHTFDAPVEFEVEWVPIERPDDKVGTVPNLLPGWSGQSDQGVFLQGWAGGGAAFPRGEGGWQHEESFFFCCTSGGTRRFGQVWEYNENTETIRLVYVSTDRSVLHNPDNVTVSAAGGLVLCEDGGESPQALVGMNSLGEVFDLAWNLNNPDEWSGAAFMPVGDWLVVNQQVPGLSFCIRGPWADAGL